MPAGFLEGVREHQRIDVFTEWHPVVYRSRARIAVEFRRVRGILVDVFYDHFLALEWERYASEPLDVFTAGVYANIRQFASLLPGDARFVAERMAEDDLLGSYRRVEGIEAALRGLSWRIKTRTGRDLGLERGVSELVANFEELRVDFEEFFPELRAHTE
jgi:acyl carrier protein phosphodiesterase